MQAVKARPEGRGRRALQQDRRRLHALGHDPQQGPAVRDLPHDRGQQQPAVSRGRRQRRARPSPAPQRSRSGHPPAGRPAAAASTRRTTCRSTAARPALSIRTRSRSCEENGGCQTDHRREHSSSPRGPALIARRTSISITPRIFDSDTILNLTFTPWSITDLWGRRRRLRICLDVPQPGLQAEPRQHARISCWNSSTTKSATRSAIIFARKGLSSATASSTRRSKAPTTA